MAALAYRLLLALPFNATVISQVPCLTDSFYGAYKLGQSTVGLFQASTAECIGSCVDSFQNEYENFLVKVDTDTTLVWLEQEDVDKSLLKQEQFNAAEFQLSLTQLGRESHEGQSQQTFQSHRTTGSAQTIFSFDQAMLVSMPTQQAMAIETILPRFWKYSFVPATPSTFRTVSKDEVAPVRRVLETFRFNPDVAAIVNNISLPQIHEDVRFLTGEDPASGIVSRHSFSPGARAAAKWIKEQIEETGASCRLAPFLEGFAPNVICRYAAVKETDDLVIISGHYDSRGSFGSVRAPGGDDDGSGTTGILSIARTIGRKGVRFHRNVELITFAGEEQGLLGSRAYSRELRAQNASVVMMIQADMTAYRAFQEPMQLGLPERIGTPEVTQLVANISAYYSPELTVGYSGACCSDHQSFIEQGFPASQVFERAGPIADPKYHNSGDLSDREGYDFNQLYAIAKVQFAAVLHVAGFELEQD